MSGGNMAFRPGDNPYLSQVGSPITTQGEVTLNCRSESGEIQTRRRNMESNDKRARSYPGGEVLDNLQIMPFELVFGWINRQGRNQIPGHPNHIGFSSLNGVKWGDTSTDAELEMRIRFVGLAKTPYLFENAYQLKHGFTAIGVGSGTTFHTGDEDIFPGDKLYWAVVPRPLRTSNPFQEAPLPGGQYGDNGPGSRQGNPRIGTPRGKLRFIINPSRFNDMRPSFEGMLSKLFKPMEMGGVADRPFEHLFSDVSLGDKPKPTPMDEFAMSVAVTKVVSLVRGMKVLSEIPGLTAGLNPASSDYETQLCDRIGVFKTSPAERRPFINLINAWYLGLGVNRSASNVEFQKLRQRFPTYFDNLQRIQRRPDTTSRFLQVATNLHTYEHVGYARAVHAVARKRFATALSYAKKGQRVDVLIGHFLESF